MTEINLSVPEIHCNHCKASIESALSGLEGVVTAEVDVPSTSVAVAFKAPATGDSITAAIEALGYQVPSPA